VQKADVSAIEQQADTAYGAAKAATITASDPGQTFATGTTLKEQITGSEPELASVVTADTGYPTSAGTANVGDTTGTGFDYKAVTANAIDVDCTASVHGAFACSTSTGGTGGGGGGGPMVSEVTLPSGASTTEGAYLTAVACSTTTDCAAVGFYYDSSGNGQVMVESESAGTWGSANEITLPANADVDGGANLYAVACPTAGNCVATGTYVDTSGNSQAMVATSVAGTWGQASEVSAPTNAGTNPSAALNLVDCTSVGNCVATGLYVDTPGNGQAMIATETDSTWGAASEVTLPSGADTVPGYQDGYVDDLTCPTAGHCVLVGSYAAGGSSFGDQQVMVATESSGWTASEITLPSGAYTYADGQSASFSANALACDGSGQCVAGGSYIDSSDNYQAMVVTGGTSGTWTASKITDLPEGAVSADFTSLSCTASGSCDAAGIYYDDLDDQYVLVAAGTTTDSGGSWSTSSFSLPSVGTYGDLSSLVCSDTDDCTAVGYYNDVSDNGQVMLGVVSGGTWGAGSMLTLPSGASTTPGSQSASLASLACPATGDCAAVGYYYDSSGTLQAMVATEVDGVWDTTTPAAPVATIPANGGFINTSEPTLHATAPVGTIVSFYVDHSFVGTSSVDGSGNASFTLFTPLEDGVHSFYAYDVNNADTESVVSNTNSFTVITVAPAAPVITSPADGSSSNVTSPSVTLTGAANDSVSVDVDGTLYSTTLDGSGNGSVIVGPLSAGAHTVRATETDAASNVSAWSATSTFTIKTTTTVTLTGPAAGPTSTIHPTVTYSAEAGDSFVIDVDGVSTATGVVDGSGLGSVTLVTALSAGDHTIEITVTDAVGNNASDSIVIDVAATSVVAFTQSPAAVTSDPSAVFAFSDGVATDTYECALDGGTYSACVSPDTIADLANGAHTLSVRALDSAGTASASTEYTWTVNTTPPPAPTILGGPNHVTTPGPVVFIFSAAADSTFECVLDDGTYKVCTSPYHVPTLADGKHVLRVRAVDAAGNVGPASVYTWNVRPRVRVRVGARAHAKLLVAAVSSTYGGNKLEVGCNLNTGIVKNCVITALYRGHVIGEGSYRSPTSAHTAESRTVVAVRLNARGQHLLARAT